MTISKPHSIPLDKIYAAYGSSKAGLTSLTALDRLKQDGPNLLSEKKKKSILSVLASQFKDIMVIVLIIAAIISFAVSYFEGTTDYADPLIILAIIILNSILGTYQQYKAYNSLEALKKLSSPTTNVLRDGKLVNIPSSELVCGDIVSIDTGAYVPADLRIISCNTLTVDESALTGESVAVTKHSDVLLPPDSVIGDHTNMLYSSSIIATGHAQAIVTATGHDTEVGHIADIIANEDSPLTPLQIKLAKTSTMLGITALLICFAIFIIGIASKRPIFDMFLTSVSLAVASIPEGLPVIITIMLSLGVTRMAAKNAIVRYLPAVETLGSATYICSDKTGTLTQNKMTVTTVVTKDSEESVLSLAALCCNNLGEPTENAIVNAALERHLTKQELDKQYPRLEEYAFDSKRKMMTTVHRLSNGNYRSITKGAFDVIIDKCNISSEQKRYFVAQNELLASKALRVIAVAYNDSPVPTIEKSLTMSGLLGLIDPPRKEVLASVNSCIKAGIKPVMITGDHPVTGCAIAKELNILPNNSNIVNSPLCITGTELNSMSDEELITNVTRYSVFARVSPFHKVRIVKALQNNNQVVAMTGDGVNDAPALKIADIGCSMGLGGTDVAKNASDIILADDNFSTIVEAVKEGRAIFDNIRKSIHFLLSSNIGEIITILCAILFGLPTPLIAIQLLWINLVTDSLPAIALGMEPADSDVMNRAPLSPDEGLFTKDLTAKIIVEGMMIGSLALLAFVCGYKILPCSSDNLMTGRTMAFAVLGLSQIFHSINMKSSKSIFKIKLTNNPKLLISFVICFVLQISVISISFLSDIFNTVDLNSFQWIVVMILSALPIPIVELQKAFKH